MKTGPRYLIWPRGEEFKIGSLRGITVRCCCLITHVLRSPKFTRDTAGKKLKRRLEDLERKATSVSPEPNPSELDRRSKSLEDYYDEESRSGYVSRRATSPESRHPSSQYERSLFSHQYLRPPSPTLPPVSYPTSNSALPPVSYAGAPASQQPMRYAPLSTSSEYLSNFPTHAGTQQYGHYYSDPSWSSVTRSVESNGVKQEDYEEELGPLHPSYSHMSGMELAQFQQQQQQQQQQQRQQQQKQQQRSHQQHYQQTWQGHNHHVMPPAGRPSW